MTNHPFPLGSTFCGRGHRKPIPTDADEHLRGFSDSFGQIEAVLVRNGTGREIEPGELLRVDPAYIAHAEGEPDNHAGVADPTLTYNVPVNDVFWLWWSWPRSLETKPCFEAAS